MSRNGFPECEREYNRREEAVEMAREERSRSMSDTPDYLKGVQQIVFEGCDVCVVAPEDLESLYAENARLREELEALKAELTAAKEKYFQVCAQHGRLVDQVYEEDGETLKQTELASYKLWAEVEIADLREDLSDHIRMAKDAQEDADVITEAILQACAEQREIDARICRAQGDKAGDDYEAGGCYGCETAIRGQT